MKRPQLRVSEAGGKAIVLITCAGCATALLVAPRAIPPSEMPVLSLDSQAIARVVEADEQLAKKAPATNAAKALTDIYVEQGRAELERGETARAAELRARRMRVAVTNVVRESGPNALLAPRARAVASFTKKLYDGGSLTEPDPLVGSFPRMLERYGLIREGAVLAPPFVVRTLFKARWNAVVQRPLTDALERVERQAYWGWLALEARQVEPHRRVPAAEEYAAAGGANATEARAVLAFQTGQLAHSAELFTHAYGVTGNLRLRNHALAALGGASETLHP